MRQQYQRNSHKKALVCRRAFNFFPVLNGLEAGLKKEHLKVLKRELAMKLKFSAHTTCLHNENRSASEENAFAHCLCLSVHYTIYTYLLRGCAFRELASRRDHVASGKQFYLRNEVFHSAICALHGAMRLDRRRQAPPNSRVWPYNDSA